MSDFLPPFFEEGAPGGLCSRRLGDHNCGKLAVTHIIWTSDMENGLCCHEHDAEVLANWCFYARHLWQPTCSAPGALFYHDLKVCLLPGDIPALDRTLREVMDLPEGAEVSR